MGYENSGRRPQPTALKMLRGNPSKTRLNQREPKPPKGDVVKPAMSAVAGAVWDRMAPIALAMGTLTTADVDAFKQLCHLQAILDIADQQMDAPGFGVFTLSQDYNGADKVGYHAAVKLSKEFSVVIRPYYALFGLEPVSRARLTVPKQDDAPQSKWAGALK